MRLYTILLMVLFLYTGNVSAQFSYMDSLLLLNQELGDENQNRAKEISKNIEKEIKKSDDSLEKYNEIIESGIKQFGENQGVAYLMHKKGVFLYKQKEYNLALLAFKKALDWRADYPQDKATSLYMIGVTLEKEMNTEQESIHYYQKALDEYVLLEDTLRQIRCSHRIGAKYNKLNEFDLAEKNLRKALDLQEKNTDRYARINLDLSLVLHNLEKYTAAEKCLLEAIDFFEEHENNKELYKCYNGLGNVYDGQKVYDKALDVYFKGLEILDDTDTLKQAGFNINIGETYLGLKKLDEAEKWLQKGLDLKKSIYKINLHPAYNICLHNLGVCYLEKKEYQKSLEYFQFAISSIVPDFQPDNIFESTNNYKNTIGDYQNLLDDLSFKGKTFNKWYAESKKEKYLEAAYQSFSEFGKVMELMQNEFATESSRLFWLDKYYSDIEIALSIAYERHQQTRNEEYLDFIFYTIEQNKAIVLLENLRQRINYKPKDYEIYKNRASTLVDYRTSLLQSTNPVEKNALMEKIRNLEIEQEEWKINQKENSPFVHALPPTIQEAQAGLLTETNALLNYFVGDSTVFCILLTKNNFNVFQFPKNNLQEEIKILRNTLQKPPELHEDAAIGFRNYADNAWALGEHIINPILRKLPEGIHELIILSDGELNFIPFSVLLENKAENEKIFSSKTPYLLQKYNISYGYSSAILLEYENEEKKNQFKYQLAAFAPYFDAKPSSNAMRSCSDILATLIYNKKETSEIVNMFSGNYLIENNNKAYFKERMGNTKIIHLATHACISENEEAGNRIFLEDEPLFIHELYAMDNQAEMVVLSACETGLGELKKGEGVMSLSRAFAYSGVPSTTMSLWSVNDESTKNLMVEYYRQLKDEKSKHIALANAQKEYLKTADTKTKYHPFYWAAFVHYGDTIPTFPKNRNYWMLGLIGFLGLVVFGTYRILRTAKS